MLAIRQRHRGNKKNMDPLSGQALRRKSDCRVRGTRGNSVQIPSSSKTLTRPEERQSDQPILLCFCESELEEVSGHEREQ